MAKRSSRSRIVWFHREYRRFTGGHVKHAQYFEHACRLPGFDARLTFTGAPVCERLARERRALWRAADSRLAERWEPAKNDVLFLAGTDWRYLQASGLQQLPNPRLNLVQHVRHAEAGTELHGFLRERAVRLCVSQQVADAVRGTRRANGPVFTIPNGTDAMPAALGEAANGCADGARRWPIAVVGYKRSDLASGLSQRLDAANVPHCNLLGFLDRRRFIDWLGDSDVVVCLPRATEGFYLPALEAMACGCVVVTLDCVGNRSFCVDGENCLVADATVEALLDATQRAWRMPKARRARMLAAARATAIEHSLQRERERLGEVLGALDDLWRDARPKLVSGVARRLQPGNYPPLVDFMIVGGQKCGTSALHRFLSLHPEIGMPKRKELHVFDNLDPTSRWSTQQIDERYRPYFDANRDAMVRGEATPIYMYWQHIPPALRRYNPKLKVIALIRDPVARAISQYHMEFARGDEARPLWLALLLEPFRLRRSERSRRRHGYRSRGLFSVQLRALQRCFGNDQLLVVGSEQLLQQHAETLRRTFEFLGVAPDVAIPPDVVAATPNVHKHPLVRKLLRLSYLAEFIRLRRFLRQRGNSLPRP